VEAKMIRRTGFTLIETLFATLIVLVGLTSLAMVFFYSAHMRDRLRQRTLAVPLIYTKMEELSSNWELLPGTYSQELAPESPDGKPYLATWTISEETPQRITVTLWTKDTGWSIYREIASLTTLSGSMH
jgi:Tfp pilus assembly protein PilV